MYRQWDNEMMRMANGEIDNASGSASCTSIKNSSEDLELYFIVVSLTLSSWSCIGIYKLLFLLSL